MGKGEQASRHFVGCQELPFLKEMDLVDSLKDKFLVPGARSSVCICPFDLPASISSVQDTAAHLQDGKFVWAALSKPRAQKLLGQRDGYAEGSMWHAGGECCES